MPTYLHVGGGYEPAGSRAGAGASARDAPEPPQPLGRWAASKAVAAIVVMSCCAIDVAGCPKRLQPPLGLVSAQSAPARQWRQWWRWRFGRYKLVLGDAKGGARRQHRERLVLRSTGGSVGQHRCCRGRGVLVHEAASGGDAWRVNARRCPAAAGAMHIVQSGCDTSASRIMTHLAVFLSPAAHRASVPAGGPGAACSAGHPTGKGLRGHGARGHFSSIINACQLDTRAPLRPGDAGPGEVRSLKDANATQVASHLPTRDLGACAVYAPVKTATYRI